MPVMSGSACPAEEGTIMKLARRIRTGPNVIASSAAVLVVFVARGEPAAAETLLERGSYLVNAVMACDSCHTPRQSGVRSSWKSAFPAGHRRGTSRPSL